MKLSLEAILLTLEFSLFKLKNTFNFTDIEEQPEQTFYLQEKLFRIMTMSKN